MPNARRRWWPAGAVTACWLAAAALFPGTAAAAATVSTTYETPGETPFVVPAGVNTVSVMLVGAGGGAGSNEFSNFDAPGGAGGVVHATVAVYPGEVLFAEVGSPGLPGTGLGPGNGGGNGGGKGGNNAPAGGGGGASDARTCSIHAGYPLDPPQCGTLTTVASRLAVAGGGGGGGGSASAASWYFGGGGGAPGSGGGGGGGASGVPTGTTGVTGLSTGVATTTIPWVKFTWAVPVPTAITAPPSDVTATTATLSGVIDPNGSQITACRFKVTPAPPTPAQASCSPKPQTGNTPVLVSASLTGLTPSTTYSVRVTATNAQGNPTGAPKTFKTSAAAALVLRPAGTRVAASR